MTIYKITNTITGKVYVGQTKMSLNLRWNRHVIDSKRTNSRMSVAIREYGVKAFKIEAITSGKLTKEVSDLLEIAYISINKSNDPEFGYNTTAGGSKAKLTDDTKKKISIANSGKKISEEQRAIRIMKQSERYSPEKAAEIRRNYSAASKGSKNGRALRIIDTNTGEIYGCIKEVAVALKMSPVTLRWQIRNNKHTKFKYV